MSKNRSGAGTVSILLGLILLAASVLTYGQGMFESKPIKLPWKIAFVRDKNIWLMNADGSGQKVWRTYGNVANRLAWSPDGKWLAWARQGEFTYKLPDGGGGGRRIYDVFRSEIDSTRDAYWRWVTFNHGSRSPEYSPSGNRIVYVYDINANLVDAELPDFQIVHSKLDGSDLVRLTRKDALPGECQGLEPTWSPDGNQIAFIYQRRNEKVGQGSQQAPNTSVGLAVVPSSGITIPEAELDAQAKKLPNAAAPSWSPDGRVIAYVNTSTSDGAIYVVGPDYTGNRKLVEKTARLAPSQAPVSWSPDSKWITFSSVDGFVYIMPLSGGAPQRVTSGGNDYVPAFSR